MTDAAAELHTSYRFGRFSVLMHWLIALLIVAAFVLGTIMVDIQGLTPAKLKYFAWHKWLGVTVLALAGAIASQLHDKNRAFTLFATHYFELTEFPARHRHAVNMHVSAAESGDDIVFLHAIEPGPASRSYGVQVARLAGMPSAVLRQARQTLDTLEAQQHAGEAQIDLFAPPPEPEPAPLAPPPAVAPAPTDPLADEVLQALRALDPDTLTPRAALDALYRLKTLAAAPNSLHSSLSS